MRKLHAPPLSGGKKGMYLETNTVSKQPCPVRSTVELADSSLGVQTPEGIEFVLHPAGLPVRACAYGVDVLIQWLCIGGAYLVFGALRDLIGLWMLLLIRFAVTWSYHVICECFFKGQSVGKRIFGIRVVMGSGAPVKAGASFLRNLLRSADAFMFLYLIGLLSLCLSRGFRRIGDWAADTLVVYTSVSRPLYRIAAGMPETPVQIPASPLSYEEKQAVLDFARRYPLLGKARAGEIARDYAACLKTETVLREEFGISPEEEFANSLKGEFNGAEYLLGIARGLSGAAGERL
ncbi:MAG: RDD family protein [Treponema sp.]|jgi:uncharacterized RDD family membrane protein YckC|nr:RDD family protein [Treponema sp.]